MTKNLICILYSLSLVTGYASEEKESHEDLTSYSLTKRELLLLKGALDIASHLSAEELGALATQAQVDNDTAFMQKWNSMSKKEMTQYAFFVFTNPRTTPYIDAILKDKARLHLFSFILGYLERDMEEEMLEFGLLRDNASKIAELLSLDEHKIKKLLDEKDYSSFFLYLARVDRPVIEEEDES